MIFFISKYNNHLLLIFIGLLVIIGFNYVLQISAQNIIYPDSESYFEAAKNVYCFYRGHNHRPIILAAIHGFPFLFGASNWQVYTTFTYITNTFFWLATLLVFYEILLLLITKKTAFIITFLCMFFVGLATTIFHMLSETIFVFFILFGFYFLLKHYQNNRFLYLSIAISIFIMAMLVRPGVKFFTIILLFIYIKKLLFYCRSKAILPIYGTLLLVFIQCAGLKYQFGNFTISYIDSITYYSYLGSRANCIAENKKFVHKTDSRLQALAGIDYPEMVKICQNDMINQLKNNKLNLFKAYCINFNENATTENYILNDLQNLKKTTYFDNCKTFFYYLSKGQNIIFTSLGIVFSLLLLLDFKKNKGYSIIALFVLYVYVTSAISFEQGDRFHMIAFPFVVILMIYYSKK